MRLTLLAVGVTLLGAIGALTMLFSYLGAVVGRLGGL